MLPALSTANAETQLKPEEIQQQILFTVLNIKSQQNKLKLLLAQQNLTNANEEDLAPIKEVLQDPLEAIQAQQSAKTQSQPARLGVFGMQLQSDFQFMASLGPFLSVIFKPSPAAASTTENNTNNQTGFVATKSDHKSKNFSTKILDKDAVKQEAEEAVSPTTPASVEKVQTTKKIRKNGERCLNKCGHPERKHYAKGYCNNCYHKYGRTGKPKYCEHEVIYAKGLCQKCYLVKYNQVKSSYFHRLIAFRPRQACIKRATPSTRSKLKKKRQKF